MSLRRLLVCLSSLLLVVSIEAGANNVVSDLAQGLTPVEATQNALKAGLTAEQVAAALLLAGQDIATVVDTLILVGISNQDLIAILSALPATAGPGNNGQGHGRPPPGGGGHPCTNGQGHGNGNGDRCASPS